MIWASLYLRSMSFSRFRPWAISTKIMLPLRWMSRMQGVVSIERGILSMRPMASKKTSNLIGFVKYFTTPNSTRFATFDRSMTGPVMMIGILLAFGSVCFFSRRRVRSSVMTVSISMMMRSGRIESIFVYASLLPAHSSPTCSAETLSRKKS